MLQVNKRSTGAQMKKHMGKKNKQPTMINFCDGQRAVNNGGAGIEKTNNNQAGKDKKNDQ